MRLTPAFLISTLTCLRLIPAIPLPSMRVKETLYSRASIEEQVGVTSGVPRRSSTRLPFRVTRFFQCSLTQLIRTSFSLGVEKSLGAGGACSGVTTAAPLGVA